MSTSLKCACLVYIATVDKRTVFVTVEHANKACALQTCRHLDRDAPVFINTRWRELYYLFICHSYTGTPSVPEYCSPCSIVRIDFLNKFYEQTNKQILPK